MRPILILVVVLLAPGTATGGAWTEPAGSLWFKVSGYTQTSDEFFASEGATLPDGTVVEPGDARPFDDGGESAVQQLWFDLEVGVTERLSLGVQAPWKYLEYEDRIETIRTWGWGDTHLRARYALLTGATRLTVRGGWKIPTGRFSTRPDRLPIGENQTDLELGLQIGRSLGRPLSWVNADLGRRFRLADTEFDFDPGDEWFGSLEAGYGIDGNGRFGLAGRWSFMRGDDESLNFFAPGTALARDLDEVELKLMADTGHVFVELGTSWFLGSEGYPSSPTWSLGLSRRTQLW